MAAINLDIGGNTRRLDKDIQKTVNRVYAINLKTKGDQPLGRITGQVNEFNKSLAASNARVIAFGASAGLIFGLQRAFSALVSSTIEVQKSLQDINVILNVSTAQLNQFGSELFNIAKNTGQSFSEVAKAATEFSRQGLGVAETLKRTNEALILSRLSGLDTAKSVEALTAAVNSFASQAVTATEIVNKFANVDAAFAVSSKDLAEAISRVGSSASQSGVSLNELIAIVTSAQQTTARGGAVIGNSFKTIFTRLQRTKVVDLLSNLGISETNASGQVKSTIQLLQDLAKVYDNLGAQQQAYIAEQVGGVFQINILKSALADLGKEFSIYNSALNVAGSTTDQAIRRNEELNKTYLAQINALRENAKQLATNAGGRLLGPTFERVVGGANELLGGVNESDGQGVGAALGKGILDGLGQILSGPGLILIGGVLLKLTKDFSVFATGSAKSLLGLNTAAEQQKNIQTSITQILAKNPDLLKLALKGEEGLNAVANTLLQNLRSQTVELQKQAQVAAQIAKAFYGAGVRVSGGVPVVPTGKTPKAKSGGFIPNFSIQSELTGIKKSGDYTSSQKRKAAGDIRTANIPGIGSTVFNGQETIAKSTQVAEALGYPKGTKPKNPAERYSILTPKMSDDLGIAAQGFIPNFAEDKNISQYQKGFAAGKVFDNAIALSLGLKKAYVEDRDIIDFAPNSLAPPTIDNKVKSLMGINRKTLYGDAKLSESEGNVASYISKILRLPGTQIRNNTVIPANRGGSILIPGSGDKDVPRDLRAGVGAILKKNPSVKLTPVFQNSGLEKGDSLFLPNVLIDSVKNITRQSVFGNVAGGGKNFRDFNVRKSAAENIASKFGFKKNKTFSSGFIPNFAPIKFPSAGYSADSEQARRDILRQDYRKNILESSRRSNIKSFRGKNFKQERETAVREAQMNREVYKQVKGVAGGAISTFVYHKNRPGDSPGKMVVTEELEGLNVREVRDHEYTGTESNALTIEDGRVVLEDYNPKSSKRFPFKAKYRKKINELAGALKMPVIERSALTKQLATSRIAAIRNDRSGIYQNSRYAEDDGFASGFIPNFAQTQATPKNIIDVGDITSRPSILKGKIISLIYPEVSQGFQKVPATAVFNKQTYKGLIPVAGIEPKPARTALPDLKDSTARFLTDEANNFGKILGATNFLKPNELPNRGAVDGAAGNAFEGAVMTLFKNNVKGRAQNAGIDFTSPSAKVRKIFNNAPGQYDAKISPELVNDVFSKLLSKVKPGVITQRSGAAGKEYQRQRDAAIEQLNKEGVTGTALRRKLLKERFGIFASGYIPNFALPKIPTGKTKGTSQRLGYIDGDELRNPRFKSIVNAEMQKLGMKSYGDYHTYLANMAMRQKKLDLLFAPPGTGKTTLAQGGIFKKPTRAPVLRPSDIAKFDKIVDTRAKPNVDKIAGIYAGGVNKATFLMPKPGDKAGEERILQNRIERARDAIINPQIAQGRDPGTLSSKAYSSTYAPTNTTPDVVKGYINQLKSLGLDKNQIEKQVKILYVTDRPGKFKTGRATDFFAKGFIPNFAPFKLIGDRKKEYEDFVLDPVRGGKLKDRLWDRNPTREQRLRRVQQSKENKAAFDKIKNLPITANALDNLKFYRDKRSDQYDSSGKMVLYKDRDGLLNSREVRSHEYSGVESNAITVENGRVVLEDYSPNSSKKIPFNSEFKPLVSTMASALGMGVTTRSALTKQLSTSRVAAIRNSPLYKAAGYIPNFAAEEEAKKREMSLTGSAVTLYSNKLGSPVVVNKPQIAKYGLNADKIIKKDHIDRGQIRTKSNLMKTGSGKEKYSSKASGFIPNFAPTNDVTPVEVGDTIGALLAQVGILGLVLQNFGSDVKAANASILEYRTSLLSKQKAELQNLEKGSAAYNKLEKSIQKTNTSIQKLEKGNTAAAYGQAASSALLIAAPIIAETIKNAIGQETKAARVTGEVVSSTGNILSTAALAATIAPQGKGGKFAGIAAVATALLSSVSIIKQLNTNLPELGVAATEASENLSAFSNVSQETLKTFEQISEFRGRGQAEEAGKLQTKLLTDVGAQVKDPAVSARIQTAILNQDSKALQSAIELNTKALTEASQKAEREIVIERSIEKIKGLSGGGVFEGIGNIFTSQPTIDERNRKRQEKQFTQGQTLFGPQIGAFKRTNEKGENIPIREQISAIQQLAEQNLNSLEGYVQTLESLGFTTEQIEKLVKDEATVRPLLQKILDKEIESRNNILLNTGEGNAVIAQINKSLDVIKKNYAKYAKAVDAATKAQIALKVGVEGSLRNIETARLQSQAELTSDFIGETAPDSIRASIPAGRSKIDTDFKNSVSEQIIEALSSLADIYISGRDKAFSDKATIGDEGEQKAAQNFEDLRAFLESPDLQSGLEIDNLRKTLGLENFKLENFEGFKVNEIISGITPVGTEGQKKLDELEQKLIQVNATLLESKRIQGEQRAILARQKFTEIAKQFIAAAKTSFGGFETFLQDGGYSELLKPLQKALGPLGISGTNTGGQINQAQELARVVTELSKLAGQNIGPALGAESNVVKTIQSAQTSEIKKVLDTIFKDLKDVPNGQELADAFRKTLATKFFGPEGADASNEEIAAATAEAQTKAQFQLIPDIQKRILDAAAGKLTEFDKGLGDLLSDPSAAFLEAEQLTQVLDSKRNLLLQDILKELQNRPITNTVTVPTPASESGRGRAGGGGGGRRSAAVTPSAPVNPGYRGPAYDDGGAAGGFFPSFANTKESIIPNFWQQYKQEKRDQLKNGYSGGKPVLLSNNNFDPLRDVIANPMQMALFEGMKSKKITAAGGFVPKGVAGSSGSRLGMPHRDPKGRSGVTWSGVAGSSGSRLGMAPNSGNQNIGQKLRSTASEIKNMNNYSGAISRNFASGYFPNFAENSISDKKYLMGRTAMAKATKNMDIPMPVSFISKAAGRFAGPVGLALGAYSFMDNFGGFPWSDKNKTPKEMSPEQMPDYLKEYKTGPRPKFSNFAGGYFPNFANSDWADRSSGPKASGNSRPINPKPSPKSRTVTPLPKDEKGLRALLKRYSTAFKDNKLAKFVASNKTLVGGNLLYGVYDGLTRYGNRTSKGMGKWEAGVRSALEVGLGFGGSVLGGKTGAKAGGLIGATGGPVALAGAAAGGVVGSTAGYYGGSVLGGYIGDAIFGPEKKEPLDPVLYPKEPPKKVSAPREILQKKEQPPPETIGIDMDAVLSQGIPVQKTPTPDRSFEDKRAAAEKEINAQLMRWSMGASAGFKNYDKDYNETGITDLYGMQGEVARGSNIETTRRLNESRDRLKQSRDPRESQQLARQIMFLKNKMDSEILPKNQFRGQLGTTPSGSQSLIDKAIAQGQTFGDGKLADKDLTGLQRVITNAQGQVVGYSRTAPKQTPPETVGIDMDAVLSQGIPQDQTAKLQRTFLKESREAGVPMRDVYSVTSPNFQTKDNPQGRIVANKEDEKNIEELKKAIKEKTGKSVFIGGGGKFGGGGASGTWAGGYFPNFAQENEVGGKNINVSIGDIQISTNGAGGEINKDVLASQIKELIISQLPNLPELQQKVARLQEVSDKITAKDPALRSPPRGFIATT